MEQFSEFIKIRRKELSKERKGYSQRQVALRIGIEPSYLSKLERGHPVALSEEKTIALAAELEEDPDFLLALSGKVSSDVQGIIKKRPSLFARIVREMKELPDELLQSDVSFRLTQKRASHAYSIGKVGFFDLSLTQKKSTWSPPAQLLLGVDRAASFQSLCETLTSDDRIDFEKLCQKAQRDETTFECEVHINCQSTNQTIPVRIWGEYEYDTDNKAISLLGGIQDISDIVQLRNELELANEKLSGQVTLQSQELRNVVKQLHIELNEKSKLTDDLIKSKTKIKTEIVKQRLFFRETSHSIRSLLDTISQSINKAENSEHDFNNFQNSIRSCTLRLTNKINDILDFTELSEGLSPMHEICRFDKFANEINTAFANEFKKRNIAFELLIAPNLPKAIITDIQRLTQITYAILEYTLISNTWGTVQLSINIADLPPVLSISFSGIHYKNLSDEIDPFDVMSIEHSHTPDKALCLGMITPILNGLNGSIQIDTPQGQSSRITALLPVALINKPRTKSDKIKDSGIKVLIVEDDITSSLSLETFLRKKKCIPLVAASAEQATKACEAEKFDIILMDIQLPDGNGMEIVNKIRLQDNLNHETPVIAVTAYAMVGDKNKFLQSGMADYVSKPVDYAVLFQKIVQLLD